MRLFSGLSIALREEFVVLHRGRQRVYDVTTNKFKHDG